MSASMGSELKAEPNLTPLLDVVFQLITFFMLVINFSQDNFDSRVKLPIAGSARPQDDADQGGRGAVGSQRRQPGQPPVQRPDPLGRAGRARRSSLKPRSPATISSCSKGNSSTPNEELPARVVIRADRDTAFSSLFASDRHLPEQRLLRSLT